MELFSSILMAHGLPGWRINGSAHAEMNLGGRCGGDDFTNNPFIHKTIHPMSFGVTGP
jgi:hypothetical protein